MTNLPTEERLPWVKSTDRLPEFNRLVLAYLEGAQEHSGHTWRREGFAFMVRHDDPPNTVADAWARDRYETALKGIGADYATVTHWVQLGAPHVQ